MKVENINNLEQELFETKNCIVCHQTKPLEDFYKNKRQYYKKRCKECDNKKRNELDKKQRNLQYSNTKEDLLKYLNLIIRKSVNKRNCIKKNNSSNLSQNDLLQTLKKQNYNCPYTNKPLIHSFTNPLLSPSIDRIDSDKDYTKDNIVITFRAINLAKNKYTKEQFKEFIDYITK